CGEEIGSAPTEGLVERDVVEEAEIVGVGRAEAHVLDLVHRHRRGGEQRDGDEQKDGGEDRWPANRPRGRSGGDRPRRGIAHERRLRPRPLPPAPRWCPCPRAPPGPPSAPPRPPPR